jgi:hypothetical protein
MLFFKENPSGSLLRICHELGRGEMDLLGVWDSPQKNIRNFKPLGLDFRHF